MGQKLKRKRTPGSLFLESVIKYMRRYGVPKVDNSVNECVIGLYHPIKALNINKQ